MHMYIRLVILLKTNELLCLGACLVLNSTLIVGQDTLWINASTWTPQATSMPVLRLNDAPEFNIKNAPVFRSANQESSVVIVNTDTVEHNFAVWAEDPMGISSIGAQDTLDINLPAVAAGTYGCGLIDVKGRWLGAQSLFASESITDTLPTFLWNLAEWDVNRMNAIAENGDPADFENYIPQYFTINEAMHPATLEDSTAWVTLPVNTSALIRIHNAGAMDHVLHFHGFHVSILSSTHHPERVGWSKDTQPLKVNEGMTVLLHADQAGSYPVHDHNLIAVTNAGLYPGGMLIQIQVDP